MKSRKPDPEDLPPIPLPPVRPPDLPDELGPTWDYMVTRGWEFAEGAREGARIARRMRRSQTVAVWSAGACASLALLNLGVLLAPFL